MTYIQFAPVYMKGKNSDLKNLRPKYLTQYKFMPSTLPALTTWVNDTFKSLEQWAVIDSWTTAPSSLTAGICVGTPHRAGQLQLTAVIESAHLPV